MVEDQRPETQIPKEIEERNIRGVAAVIVSGDGKILLVQETVDKPHIDKHAGDWSIPAETMREGEDEIDALSRLIAEEVGEEGDITCNPAEDWLGDYRVKGRKDKWARAYVLRFNGTSDTPRSFRAVGDEVINHRWIDPKEIKDLPRRAGVLEVVEDFIAGRQGVICEECSSGFRPNQ